jgi:deoxyribonuclease-4
MSTSGFLLGSNVSTVGGLHRAFLQATEWRCEAIQVYTTPSRRWNVPPLDPEKVAEYFENWRNSPTQKVVSHVPFIVNTAAGDEDARERSRRRLIQEVARASELGVESVVLHPGSGGPDPRSTALQRTADAIKDALDKTSDSDVRILIENMAGQGSMLCARFEEIAELLELIGHDERVGVCLDTAHAFMAGYPMTRYAGYEEVMKEFDAHIGIHRIAAIHANDSLTDCGSRHDRHAPAGQGLMGTEVFHALVRDDRFKAIPLVLEVPNRDAESGTILNKLRELRILDPPLTKSSEEAPAGLR